MLLQEVIERVKFVGVMVERDKEEVGEDAWGHSTVAFDDILFDVLTAIATGQCRDYPPEEFAAEALKAFSHFPKWARKE